MEVTKPEINNELGAIRIADEVVATVAGLAASEVEGVASMSGGWGTDLVEKLGRKNFGKGIRVEVIDEETKIDIFLVIDYGYQIPKVAEEVQKEVKQAVETMTGLKVSSVNVHIVSVILKKSEAQEAAAGEELKEY
ncbi:MAG TPA: Asp23/Gls24 family envelope stress response protein [Syntrophomonadaceae bacterium]|nr:Asp23/Gls24 family envelope stress response protein [Syntrophomonadaceae bacterium]HNX28305.1 Asp23/Gls24 family envelope stress response protein [Syntrophomonadaceae bacterium]HPR92512.1 Asp23/Gls24 family envelope stress response protein [Syntrophomonadaceae bacterium]